ncbi:(Fe-S)-binding protein [Gephyromycinifex aptenodytis]|uniref:(Fe-S)-binding protein n=1 Tax=Gephyromycinifex aptenodytis TaxID=2716227 RepID=UPI001447C875|nr:(Fe-S)-binding protein [Gephyromycinifex aptenodytis]
MSALQITAIVLCLIIPTVGWLLLVRQVWRYTKLFRSGAPDPTRTNQPGRRTATLLREFLGHTRMARLPVVAIAHWFTALGFLILFSTLVNAFFQLVWPEFRLPIIGHFPPFEWVVELFAWGCLIGIILLMSIRQKNHPRRAAGERGRRSRFFGSTWWEAYFVEIIILLVSICILSLRSQEAALVKFTEPETTVWVHFPLTAWTSGIWGGLSEEWLRESIIVVAAIKILISFTWMITVSLTPTMGVAWHRFLAFFNIWFKRHADGRTSLGELQPMKVGGTAVTAENLEEVMELAEGGDGEEDAEISMGVGKIDDFTWKQLLDFSTCTECGRCQSQCPAWNTDKPLSPKLLVMAMRDHSNAMMPWLTASAEDRPGLPEHTRKLAQVSLVGDTGYEQDRPLAAYDALGPDAIIDSDVLWSCTTCGACVEQCPVDIEHVDAIVDMRRNQVLIESAFPAEFGGLFKNLESKQNPWGMAPKMRMDWAKGLEFDIPIVGQDVEDLSSVDYLFWVGCAGAFEDRAKKTTRAVAELLDEAGVSFAVLGEGEACTGDSARRAGNEILYQMLAAQNIEMLNEAGAKKIVVTCAHCYNTLRNEYPQNGGQYEVVHHTQLLNRLVREKKLVPVARPEEHPGLSSAKKVASTGPSVTYHDPCYLGRHNHVYAPPRELIGSLPGVELREMPRHGQKSFCCGAGGARMWAEEKLGTRVNGNRTAEAVATGADRIAIGCPFCRVMLSDSLTAMQSEGEAREEVEVVDIAQMLLAAVRRGESPDASQELAATAAGERGAQPDTAAASADQSGVAQEAAEGGPAEVAASDATAQAAQEAREEMPGQDAPAKKKAGAMSAADALAMMQAQSGNEAAEPAAETPAAPAAAPKGKMSAADALAMMQAQSGNEAAEPAAETPAAPAAAPKGKMSAADALAMMQAQSGSQPAEPAAAAPAAEAPTAPAKPAEMPKGKMSAADALAMMQAQSASRPAEPAAAEPATAAPAAEAPTAPAKPAGSAAEKPVAMPTGKMSAADALAMMQAQSASQPAESAEPAEPAEPVAKAPATPAKAAESAPTAPADAPAQPAQAAARTSLPTGKMTASEALAAMMAGAGDAEPQPEPESVAQPATQAEPEQAPAAEQPTPSEKSGTVAGPSEGTEHAAPQAVEQTEAQTPAAASPAAASPAPTAKTVHLPSGRMSAAEALALMKGAQAAAPDQEEHPAPGPQASPQPETVAEPAEAPQPPAEATATPATDPEPAAEPMNDAAATSAPTAEPENAAATGLAAAPATDPEPAAEADAEPAPAPTPSTPASPARSGAWAAVQEAAGGKPISSSEALKILRGE